MTTTHDTITTGARVWVETLLVSRLGTYVDDDGAPCYGGDNLSRVTLDDTPDRVFQVARGQVRPVAPAPAPIAHRVHIREARAAFANGAEILVSERGHETTRNVYPTTTTHTRDTVAWSELVDMVDMWRNRYPDQRYYIVTR